MLWPSAVPQPKAPSSSVEKNKNAVPAYLEHITAVTLAIRVSKIESVTLPISRSAVP